MIGEIQSILQGYLNAVGIPTVVHGTVINKQGSAFSVRIDDKTIIPSDIIEVPARLQDQFKMKIPQSYSGSASDGTVNLNASSGSPSTEISATFPNEVKNGAVVALLQYDKHQRYFFLGRIS